MKITKLGFVFLLLLGLGACTKTKVLPEISDETIRADAVTAFQYLNLISIDAFTYTIDKTSSSNWTATGQMAVTTQQGQLKGGFGITYHYNGTKWVQFTQYFNQTKAVLNEDQIKADLMANLRSGDSPAILELNYSLNDIKPTTWTIKGSLKALTTKCMVTADFVLNYTNVDHNWNLLSNEITIKSCVDTAEEPTSTAAFYWVQDQLSSDNDLFIELNQITSVDQTLDPDKGTALFVFHYTLTNALITKDYTVAVKASHSLSGWMYQIDYTDITERYDYKGSYALTWDILDTETFYKNNETMKLVLEGSIQVKSIHGNPYTVTILTPLSAIVTFRGVEYAVTPIVLNGNEYTSLILKYGSSEKETVTLSYGEEAYRDGQMCCPIFYGVSADQSHAKVVCTK